MPHMRIQSYKNHLLIAMPSMQGQFFAKSVVFVYEHSENEGALGFTINKPLSATLGNVFEHLGIKTKEDKISNLPVYSGGPVGPDQGFVIHDYISMAKSDGDVTISTTREMLADIACGKGPPHFIITLGYSGWEPGQLEKEIMHNDWLVAPLEKSILFTAPISQRWILAAQSIGIDVNKLSSQVGHA